MKKSIIYKICGIIDYILCIMILINIWFIKNYVLTKVLIILSISVLVIQIVDHIIRSHHDKYSN